MVMYIFLIMKILQKELQHSINQENGVNVFLILQMETILLLDPMMIQFIFTRFQKLEHIHSIGLLPLSILLLLLEWIGQEIQDSSVLLIRHMPKSFMMLKTHSK